jgi:sugar O-acyltransferase (sialic acid O-acetyltransferase NeuD family)
MSEALYILGGGGHGRVLLDTLRSGNLHIDGILDPSLEIGTQLWSVPILGGDEYLDTLSPQEVFLVNGIGANPQTTSRYRLFTNMKARGFKFRAITHPTAIIGAETKIGEGCQVMAGSIIQCGVILGENVVINTRASVDHDCNIEPHVFISPSVTLCGDVIVEASSFVGAGAVILPGIRIGASAIVGAGAVVTKPVPAGWVVAGNPAVKIGVNHDD